MKSAVLPTVAGAKYPDLKGNLQMKSHAAMNLAVAIVWCGVYGFCAENPELWSSGWIPVSGENGVWDDYYSKTSADDCSFRFRVMRYSDAIGVEAYVRDDKVVVDDCKENLISCETWKDDCLEVFFDGDGDKNPNTRGPDENNPLPCNAGGEYAIAANGSSQSDYASAKKCFGTLWGGVAEPWIESNGAKAGTHYKLWFKWACLNRPAPRPNEEARFGFTICVHDDDDGGANDHALYWKGNHKIPYADESQFGGIVMPAAMSGENLAPSELPLKAKSQKLAGSMNRMSAAVSADGGRVVRTGSIIEAKYGVDSAVTVSDEGIGDALLMFKGPWTAEKIRAVGEHCRKHGTRFSMDEMFDRWKGDWKKQYQPIREEVLKAVNEYRDVCDGTQHYSESGGLMFYWHPHDARSNRVPAAKDSYADAFAAVSRQMSAEIAQAKAGGLVPPYFSIECSFGFAPYLLRAGWDRVDLEVIYSDELERSFAGVKTASEAFGRKTFGTDMAMEWYGGMQSDGLWENRWRNSLCHAYLRGADPIYNEHGLMDRANHGHNLDRNHPTVKRYRQVLADFAKWAKAHPRAEGYPLAAVGAIQGRFDGYAGVFQSHLFGQRTNELFRVAEADRAWRLFDGLYRRRAWQDRDRWGDADYSGNPPLGAAGILPFDAADREFAKYKFLFFLGRNVMDGALYGKLVDYVKSGGTLMLAASHLDGQDVPKGAFLPYNGGDWTELVGVRMLPDKPAEHLKHGMKFVGNPSGGWNFQPLTEMWDPDFIEGGFDIPELEAKTATPFAVASDRFYERSLGALKPVLYENRIGKGRVIFLASLNSPGAPGVKRLYAFLLAKAMEAVGKDVWPKVECSDTVRWSVYPDGTIYLLNTEDHLSQEAVVTVAADRKPETIRMTSGECAIIFPKGKAD